ncbi:MAG TPA: CvpA family protein [Bacteroidales bacterium]|nr:CvpA family protein [Bacteroidales bacterium]
MVWIDVVIGLLLILDLLKGVKRGFVSEAGTIIGILAGFFLASSLGNTTAHFLLPICGHSPQWSGVLGFLMTFLIVLVLILILSKVFESFLKALSLGWMNKLAGGFFCFLRGILVLSIVLNLYQAVDKDCSLIGKEKVKASVFYKPIRNFASSIFPTVRLFKHPEDPLKVDNKQMEV